MADWEVQLPGKVEVGDTGHVADHNTIVDAIKEARTNIEEIPKGDKGPKGDPGADGKDGAKGDPGKDGKDGFGTEKQYNDIISRLEALEDAVDGGDDGDGGKA